MPDPAPSATASAQMSDAELIKLAAAEREAGIPDQQTAQSAAAAQQRAHHNPAEPNADKEQMDEPSDEEAAAQLGELS